MAEKSEQEMLADLVGGQDDKEPVVTGDILMDQLRSKLGDAHPSQVDAMSKEIEAYGDVAVSTIKKVGSAGSDKPQPRNINAEKILLTLCDVKENLVEAFEGCSMNSAISQCLTAQINKIGSCIIKLGGNSEEFEPLNHVSGLDAPDGVKNAEEVIKRTIQCYKLGTVKEAKIKDEGKEISIVFEGVDHETKYSATGRIISKGWAGTEAIDYVYTPKSGKMSVKAFEGGRWINKSSNGNYNISWSLEEDTIQNTAKNIPIKEEVPQNAQNIEPDIEFGGDEDIGTPIK